MATDTVPQPADYRCLEKERDEALKKIVDLEHSLSIAREDERRFWNALYTIKTQARHVADARRIAAYALAAAMSSPKGGAS